MQVRKAIRDTILWRGLNFLSVFFLNVLLVRMLESSQAGYLFFFINNLSLAILVLSFSLESGMGYYAAGGKIPAGHIAMLAMIWSLVSTLLVLFFYPGFGSFLSPPEGIDTAMAAVLFILGNLLTTFYSSLFFSKGEFVIPNLFLLIINVVMIVLFILGLLGLLADRFLVLAYFSGFMLQGTCIAIFYFLHTSKIELKFPSGNDLRKILSYSSAAFLSNIVFFLVYRIDYWFVEYYCNASELGNYIQVSKLVQWLMLVPMMISTALFPVTAAGADPGITAKVISLSRLLLWIYLLGCVVAALTGYWLFVWVFGKTFSLMYPVFLLHIPGILALASLYPVSSYHAGIKRVDINVRGSLMALATILALNLIFTPAYGIYAAAVASSLGYAVYYFYSLYLFARNQHVSFNQFVKPVPADFLLLKSFFNKRIQGVS